MNLKQCYLIENACYKTGRKLNIQGLMLHSTGANNPNISRYVPLEVTKSNNWNTNTPGGREVCVHGFIGQLEDGSIASVQTLPWDMQGWHCGGKGNQTHIGVEICEDVLNDADYFNKVYNEAVELFAYLCKKFNLNPLTQIICHDRGIASNHADVMHWFPRFGKSMDTFRNDVNAKVKEESTPQQEPETSVNKIDVKYQVYANGKWYPDVINTTDYAGVFGQAVRAFRGNTVGNENTVGKLIYRVHTKNGSWLGEIIDREKDKSGDNFAGILGRPIDAIMIKATKGTAKYRVHLKNSGWLPWVMGYDVSDNNNGYAGILGSEIDAIQVKII